MSPETNTPETSAIVPVSSPTDAMVDQELANESDEIRTETKALIDAIRKRAQAEIQAAGDLTRDTYLNAVRQAREAIEQDKLVDRDRIEKSIELIQQEAEKNWQSIANEVEALGTRLADAARAAWNKLVYPETDNTPKE